LPTVTVAIEIGLAHKPAGEKVIAVASRVAEIVLLHMPVPFQ
jgi:hypothetical protein